MTNLPISNNITAAQPPGKPASPDDASPQGADGFGQVLARQVADSTAPADKKADAVSADAPSSATLTDKESAPALDLIATLPADMLAALLAQQNPVSTAQPANNLQLAVNNPAQSGVPAASLTAAADTGSNALCSDPLQQTGMLQAGTVAQTPLMNPAEKAGISQAALTAQEGARQSARGAALDNALLAGALKSTAKNEVIPTLGKELPRNLSLAELASAAQQSSETAFATLQGAAPAIRDAAHSGLLAVSTPLAQAGWGNEFSQKITWLATQRNQSAELHLNPPQLGPLDVVIKVSADQATAMFTSPHAAVREAIEQALPKLREMLADNGIMLGNATVSDQASRRDPNDFARAQQGPGTTSGHAEDMPPVITQGELATNLPRHNGMVDTFA